MLYKPLLNHPKQSGQAKWLLGLMAQPLIKGPFCKLGWTFNIGPWREYSQFCQKKKKKKKKREAINARGSGTLSILLSKNDLIKNN